MTLEHLFLLGAYASFGVYLSRKVWFSDWDRAFDESVDTHPDPAWRRLIRHSPARRSAKLTMFVGGFACTAFWPLWLLSSLMTPTRKDD